MITSERLHEVLHYDQSLGIFTWLVARKGVKVGAIAGCLSKNHGYRYIRIDGRLYKEHRLIWLWMTGVWPTHGIDHINGTRSDNRWINLREATQSQNLANAGRRIDNTSGFKGVTWVKQTRRWMAQTTKAGRHIHLGYFATAEEAHVAYVAAAHEHHGEFARFT